MSQKLSKIPTWALNCIYLEILDFWLFFNTSAIFPILVIDFRIPCHLSPGRSQLVYGLGTSLLATMINDIGTSPELCNLHSIYETSILKLIHWTCSLFGLLLHCLFINKWTQMIKSFILKTELEVFLVFCHFVVVYNCIQLDALI